MTSGLSGRVRAVLTSVDGSASAEGRIPRSTRFWRSSARLRACRQTPRSTWEPGKLEQRPFARLASSPLSGNVPFVSALSIKPVKAGYPRPVVRPRGRHRPSRPPRDAPGRKDHHCARYIWAHERSSPSPSQAPSSSAPPRRPRPPHRRPRPRPSRSSGSPRPSTATRGATARPARPRSIAPASSPTPSRRPVTRRSSATRGSDRRARST